MSTRNGVTLTPDAVVKTFTEPERYEAEVRALTLAPWASPQVIEIGDMLIATERLKPATTQPGWRPLRDLKALLERLHATGLNHRDVHVANIVRCPSRGPLLIDWEWSTTDVGPRSYDLHGPGPSTTPHPEGKRGISMWIGARHKLSVARHWGR